MASISSLGIGSGLDLNGLLDQLDEAERGKLKPIERQIETQQVKISAYGKLEGALSAFQTAAKALNDASLYQSLSTSVSGDAVQAAAGSDATIGQYDVTVNHLATAGTLASGRLEGIESLDQPLTDSEQTLTLSFANAEGGAGVDVPITIAAGSSLEDIRDAINAHEDAGVTASIVNDGAGYRLALMSSETGQEASITGLTFGDADGNAYTDPNSFFTADVTFSTAEGAGEIAQTGQDASLEVNGIPIVSASNKVEGAIQGVTLNLAEEGSSIVKVEQNTRAVREAITGFVEAFNSLKDTIGELTAFNSESGAAGDLLGDSAVRSIESRLRSVLGGGVAAEEGGFAMLSEIGISLKLDGKLEIDEERLDEVIVNDQDALSAFFAGDSTTGGLAGQLSETVTQLSGSNGALGGAKSGAENRIESLKERYIRMEQSIEGTIARYRTQFGQLDGLIAQMNQTSDYLFQQFDMMNAQLGKK
ncbi:flagellar filament capping protein FliD [Billgrantia pellis]|uniref:Flagellar hook-associated protein 2 n=1 Tax=Billgrantia pellis TaxID=2606936 RepID=A0A7V7G2R3_9GAMM|nr:flagellar filament capping protein FliD [Halomonas pellis]KAA0014484.1 flagellar filament capping protein FliD [Halomonas pellis]